MEHERPSLNSICFQIAALCFCLVIGSEVFSFILTGPTIQSFIKGRTDLYCGSEIAFFLWLLPIFYHLATAFQERRLPDTYLPLSLIGAALSCLSLGTSVRFLGHLGLASSLAAFYPLSIASIPWLFGSISWIPAIIWFSMKLGLSGFDPIIRLSIAVLASGLLFYDTRRNRYEKA
jgi:hypothetical protein